MKMPVKNFLWLAFEPADEREKALYQSAYAYTMYGGFILMTLVLLGMSPFSDDTVVKVNVMSSLFGLVMLLSYIIGWSRLWKEDLTMSYQQTPSVSLWPYIFAALVIYGLGIAAALLWPSCTSTYFDVSVTLSSLALTIGTWRATTMVPGPARFYMSLVFPITFVIFLKRKGDSLFDLLYAALPFFIAVTILLIPLVLLSHGTFAI